MLYDAIVVGGNFAGLSAALILGRARRKVAVIDAGLPRNRFAAHAHGFLGLDGRAPQEIMALGREQVLAYPTVQCIDGEAMEAGGTTGDFYVNVAGGATLRARRLLLASGVKDTLAPVPGLRERWGRTVVHCPYCHGYELADRPLGVLAAHPMAPLQAATLPDWGPTTYFTQGEYEPDATQAALLAARGVRIERSPIVELLGDAPALDGVRLADGRVVDIRALYTAPRTQVASPLVRQLGCALDDGPTGPYLRIDDQKRTSVAGVYAAGDAASPMPNAILAAAAGNLAAVFLHKSLMEDALVPG